MARNKRKHINYNAIPTKETAVVETASFTPSESEIPPETAPVSTPYKTVVGSLNVRRGPGKGFDNVEDYVVEGIFSEGEYDAHHRLVEGAKFNVAHISEDGVGNKWGEVEGHDAYICLVDNERQMTFCIEEA